MKTILSMEDRPLQGKEHWHPRIKTPKLAKVTRETVKPQSGPDGKKEKVPLFIVLVLYFPTAK